MAMNQTKNIRLNTYLTDYDYFFLRPTRTIRGLKSVIPLSISFSLHIFCKNYAGPQPTTVSPANPPGTAACSVSMQIPLLSSD
jgi:hypothetical protein